MVSFTDAGERLHNLDDTGREVEGGGAEGRRSLTPENYVPYPRRRTSPYPSPCATPSPSARKAWSTEWSCPTPGCFETFQRQFELKSTRSIYYCTIGLYLYPVPGHLRSHATEKPFKCNWPGCEKRFTEEKMLVRHERVRHKSADMFTCGGCKRLFISMDSLNHHCEQLHDF